MNVLLQRFGLEFQNLDPSFEFGHQCVQSLRSGSTAPNNRKADADTLKALTQIMCTRLRKRTIFLVHVLL